MLASPFDWIQLTQQSSLFVTRLNISWDCFYAERRMKANKAFIKLLLGARNIAAIYRTAMPTNASFISF
jgi:hypothetical protein